jgi:hypothetical protein
MERLEREENPEPHVGRKMDFGQGDGLAGLWRGLLATRHQGAWSQFAFAAHYIQHVNRFTFPPIEYAARRFNYLTVAAAA